MLGRVEKYITANGLLAAGDTVIVAVSGGADSVALLDLLARMHGWRFTLTVAHLNHQLRGSDSDGDEEFVRELASSHGLQTLVRRVDVKSFANAQGLSLEEAGRICRYRFFDELAAELGGKVALAHHRDDQAETVLMRLLRGSGGSGLCGMAPVSADGRYVRPLLGVTRREIEEYLRERGLRHRVDTSNDDTTFLRNRIRHELLPLLHTYNPAVTDLLCSTAASHAADEEVLAGMTGECLRRHGAVSAGRVVLHIPGVLGEQRGLRMRLYRAALRHVKGDLRRIASIHLEEIDRIVNDPTPHQDLVLPDGIRAGTSYDKLIFRSVSDLAASEAFEVAIDGPGTYPVPGRYAVTVRTGEGAAEGSDTLWTARFDLAAAPFPWTVRPFRNGDRMTPFGMAGTKKVKELFQERQVPRDERRILPLLFCGETLLWVPGVRRSSAAPVGESGGSVVTVSLTREES